MTAPALFVWFNQQNGWSPGVSLLAALAVVIVFRGFADLDTSIAPKTPIEGTMPQREIDLVDRVTLPRLYTFDVQRAQDGSAVLVYDPVVLGA